MKTTLAFTLLVCCLYLGANADDAELNDGSSSIQARKLQLGTQRVRTTKRKLTYATANACTPVEKKVVGYIREGTVETALYPALLFACKEYCTFAQLNCVAYNYDPKEKNCTILTSVTKITKAEDWTTTLVRFENDDPCDDANIIREFHQAGHDYKIFPPGDVLTPNACCKKCVEDQSVGCVAWDYQSESKKCYLKKTNPPMKPATRPGLLYTGYGCVAETGQPLVVF